MATKEDTVDAVSVSSDELDDSSSGMSGTTPEESGEQPGSSTDEYKQIREYASKETKRVNVWRLLVIASLLIAGAAVSALTYSILSSETDADSNDAVSIPCLLYNSCRPDASKLSFL